MFDTVGKALIAKDKNFMAISPPRALWRVLHGGLKPLVIGFMHMSARWLNDAPCPGVAEKLFRLKS